MKPPFSYLPALPAAVGWMAGILLWWKGCGWWLPAVVTAVGVMLMVWRRQYIAFGLYAVAAGWIVAEANRAAEAPPWVFGGGERTVSGVIESVYNTRRAQTLVVRADSVEYAGRMVAVEPFGMQVATLPRWIEPAVGAKVRFRADIEPLDAGGHFPYQADYSTLFLKRKVVAGAFIAEEEMTEGGVEPSVSAWFASRRREVIRILAHSGLSDKSYGLLTALITGNGDELESDMRDNFRATGLAHALALSGFHVGMIVMLVGLVLFPLRAWPSAGRLRIALSLLMLWGYVAMVGMPESAVRAGVMLSVFMLGGIVGRGVNTLNSLCIAILVLLTLWPYSLFSAGFQLSVCAVLGILAFAGPLNPFSPRDGWKFRIGEAVAVTLGAVLGTMALTVFYFHRFPLVFVLSNLLVVGLLPVLMTGGIVLVVAGCFGVGISWIERGIDHIVGFVDMFTQWLSSMGWAELSGLYVSGLQAMLFGLAVVSVAMLVNVTRRTWRICTVCAVGVCLLLVPAVADADPVSEAFSVGQKENVPLLVRHGNKAVLVPRCRPHLVESSSRRALRELTEYLDVRGVDTVMVTASDFTLGPYRRQGGVVVRRRVQR